MCAGKYSINRAALAYLLIVEDVSCAFVVSLMYLRRFPST